MLTVVGVALGVAVLVGMRTANDGLVSGFGETISRIAGKTDLQITAGEAGFSEEVLERVQALPVVGVAVPVIEAVVEASSLGQGTLLVLAVDMTGDRSFRDYDLQGDDAVEDPLIFLAQPDSMILSRDFATRNGLAVGSVLRLDTALGPRDFRVRGLMAPNGFATAFGGNLAVMDIYAAQRMFGRGRMFDRIDLAVKEGTSIDGARDAIQAALGVGFEVQPPAARSQQAQAMLGGFTTMIESTSAFALFIGMFIIYNSFATAVAQRRSEIGILRALGATQGQILRLFLMEGIGLGTVGSLVGLAAGALLARAIAGAMAGLVSGVYGVNQPAPVANASPTLLVLAFAVGLVASAVAALLPARDAAAVDPLHALKKSERDQVSAYEAGLRDIVGASAAFCAAALLIWRAHPAAFYASYVLVIVTVIALSPRLTLAALALVRPLLTRLRPVEGTLACDSIVRAPRRSSATVAAVMLSIALIVAFAGVARGTYRSMVEWMDSSLNADLFVMPSPRLDIRTTRFEPEMANELAALPGVGRVQRFRNARITFRGRPAMLLALEMTSVAETARVAPIAGDRSTMYRRAAEGTGIIVSDSLAQRYALHLDDPVELTAPGGIIKLPVVGIVVDFTDQQGALLVDRAIFTRYWNDEAVSDFRVFLTPGADAAAVRQSIVEHFSGKRQVFVFTNGESRAYVVRLAEQWFSLMNVQVAVGVLVAILGILNAMTVSVTDRTRELGVSRAIGAFHRQIRQMIWIEGALVALLGAALGALLGAINLWYLLEIVRRDVAGLRLPYDFPVASLLWLVPVMLGAGLIASLLPAEAAVRTPLVEALEYE